MAETVKTPRRMIAREFVTAIARMAGAARIRVRDNRHDWCDCSARSNACKGGTIGLIYD